MALLFLSVFLHTFLVNSQCPLAPALYVFGDYYSESGNNNFLQNMLKLNLTPYGVDFPLGPTGRATNGRTFVDFIAQLLGLPFVPPYLGLSEGERSITKTGVNYASAPGGILPGTSVTILGDNLSFDEQINFFQSTVMTDLPKIFKTPTEILMHLSKSIFFVEIGSGDYWDNYVVPGISNSSEPYIPQQFASLLIDTIRAQLTRLYDLGARKFVVLNIAPFGCLPGVLSNTNPRPATPCLEDLNNIISPYNTLLPRMITTLENTLIGSTFVLGDFYRMLLNSDETGFASTRTPCCELDDMGFCVPFSTPCPNRNEYFYWDGYYPTEVVVSDRATDCFNGSVFCVPINIQQLAQKE